MRGLLYEFERCVNFNSVDYVTVAMLPIRWLVSIDVVKSPHQAFFIQAYRSDQMQSKWAQR